MKKVLLTALVAVATLSLTSCYNTRILVGNVEPTEPLVNKEVEPWHNLRSGPAAERHHEGFAVCG